MGKNIVICCDGTGNQYGENKTNVVKLVEVLDRESPSQLVFYDPGVGTLGANIVVTRTAKFITKLLGLAFAYGITRNIEDAYEFLMNTYEEGDRVFIFGFSRGAYTARALAGMLHKCGLLKKGNRNLIPYATRTYRRDSDEVAKGFKDTFSRECKPRLVGVWDTVKAVGLFIPRKFPNAKLNGDVAYGYHALAIDEKRSKFRPNLWDPPPSGQTIEQVWFAGVHADVGGWHDEDGLSNIALKWMVERAQAQGLVIDCSRFNTQVVEQTDHKDKTHNPLLPFWWILLWWRRTIPDGALVHESVFKRINAGIGYAPKNLLCRSDMKTMPDDGADG